MQFPVLSCLQEFQDSPLWEIFHRRCVFKDGDSEMRVALGAGDGAAMTNGTVMRNYAQVSIGPEGTGNQVSAVNAKHCR